MRNKVYVDKARLLGRVIIISWATLILCFIVKIFGGNFFEIMSNNENYKALCEYADTHLWLDFVLAVSSSLLCECLYILAILRQYKLKLWQFALTALTCVFSWIVDIYLPTISIVSNLIMLFGLPALFLGKQYKKYLDIAIAFVLTLAFQFISLLVKNLAIAQVDDSIFIVLIYMVDLYLMCFLYYLYMNFKKECKTMGRFWVLFAGKPVEKLRKMKEKRQRKIAKLETEKNAIDIELSKKKNEK